MIHIIYMLLISKLFHQYLDIDVTTTDTENVLNVIDRYNCNVSDFVKGGSCLAFILL
jgi:hypothetical protein